MHLIILIIAIGICGGVRLIDCAVHRSSGMDWLLPAAAVMTAFALYFMSGHSHV